MDPIILKEEELEITDCNGSYIESSRSMSSCLDVEDVNAADGNLDEDPTMNSTLVHAGNNRLFSSSFVDVKQAANDDAETSDTAYAGHPDASADPLALEGEPRPDDVGEATEGEFTPVDVEPYHRNPHSVLVKEPVHRLPGKQTDPIHYCGGFLYHQAGASADTVRFKCTRTGKLNACPGLGVAGRGTGGDTIRVTLPHNHEPDTWYEQRDYLKHAVLERCATELTSFADIFDEVSYEFSPDVVSGLTYKHYEKAMGRARGNGLPPLPPNLMEYGRAMDGCGGMLPGPPYYRGVVGGGGEEGYSAVFVSPGLAPLVASSTELHMDGSFKVVPFRPPVGQLFTILAVRSDQAFPIVSVMMEQRTTKAYVAVLDYVKSLLPDMQPRTIVADYELSLQQAIQQCFPAAQCYGCWYNFADAVCKKCCTLDLKPVLRKNQHKRVLVKMCLVLPFLPPNDIPDGFEEIVRLSRSRGTSVRIDAFLRYFRETWLRRIGPQRLSVYGMPSRASEARNAFFGSLQERVTETHRNVWYFTGQLMSTDKSRTLAFNVGDAAPPPTDGQLRDARMRAALHGLAMGQHGLRGFLEAACDHAERVYVHNTEVLPEPECDDENPEPSAGGLAMNPATTVLPPPPPTPALRRQPHGDSEDSSDVSDSDSTSVEKKSLGISGAPPTDAKSDAAAVSSPQPSTCEDVLDDDSSVPVQTIRGQRPNTYVHLYGGYSYHVNCGTASVLQLKCSRVGKLNKCYGRGRMRRGGLDTIRITHPHNHAADPLLEPKQAFKSAILDRCTLEPTALREIYNEERAKFPAPVSAAVSFKSLSNSMRRARQAGQPPSPTDLRQLGRLIREQHLRQRGGARYFRGVVGDGGAGGGHGAVFVSPGLAGELTRSAELHVVGVTPSQLPPAVVGKLLSIVAVRRGHAFPIVSVLLEQSTTKAYVAVLSFVRLLLPAMQPRRIITDYEPSLQLAIQQCFPATQMYGCWYSFAESVSRKCRSLPESEGRERAAQLCLALPLLPPEVIARAFRAVAERYVDQRAFVDHFRASWLDTIGPDRLSVYAMPSRRSEAIGTFHRVFAEHDRRAGDGNLWAFVAHLMELDRQNTSKFAKLSKSSATHPSRAALREKEVKTVTDLLARSEGSILDALTSLCSPIKPGRYSNTLVSEGGGDSLPVEPSGVGLSPNTFASRGEGLERAPPADTGGEGPHHDESKRLCVGIVGGEKSESEVSSDSAKKQKSRTSSNSNQVSNSAEDVSKNRSLNYDKMSDTDEDVLNRSSNSNRVSNSVEDVSDRPSNYDNISDTDEDVSNRPNYDNVSDIDEDLLNEPSNYDNISDVDQEYNSTKSSESDNVYDSDENGWNENLKSDKVTNRIENNNAIKSPNIVNISYSDEEYASTKSSNSDGVSDSEENKSNERSTTDNFANGNEENKSIESFNSDAFSDGNTKTMSNDCYGRDYVPDSNETNLITLDSDGLSGQDDEPCTDRSKKEPNETVQTFRGQRRNTHVYDHGGYSYHVRSDKGRYALLRCARKGRQYGCSAKGRMVRGIKDSIELLRAHNHDPDHLLEQRRVLKTAILELCETTSTTLIEVYDQVCSTFPPEVVASVPFPSLASSMSRSRQAGRPPAPTDIAGLGRLMDDGRYRPLYRGLAGDGGGVEGRNAVFVSPGLAGGLASSSELHVNVVPRGPAGWRHLTVMATRGNHVFPIVNVLVERRSTEAYVAVWSYLKTLLPDMQPRTVIVDYEGALQRAIQQCFPAAQMYGCWYSFADLVCKKYRSLPAVGDSRKLVRAVKMCLALAFLPHDEIPRGYRAAADHAGGEGEGFLRWFQATWLEGVGCRRLSVHGMPARRSAAKEAYYKTLFSSSRRLQEREDVWEFIAHLLSTDKNKTAELARMDACAVPRTVASQERKLNALLADGDVTMLNVLEESCALVEPIWYVNVLVLPKSEDVEVPEPSGVGLSPEPNTPARTLAGRRGRKKRLGGHLAKKRPAKSRRVEVDDSEQPTVRRESKRVRVSVYDDLRIESDSGSDSDDDEYQYQPKKTATNALQKSDNDFSLEDDDDDMPLPAHEPLGIPLESSSSVDVGNAAAADSSLEPDVSMNAQEESTNDAPVQSLRGQRKNSRIYHYDGYSYHVNRVNSKTTYLRCSKTKCPARGSIKLDTEHTVRISRPHNHERDQLLDAKRRLKSAIMARCVTESPRLRDIYEEECLKFPTEVSASMSFKSLSSMMYRLQKSAIPPAPADLSELDAVIGRPEHRRRYALTGDGSPFYRGTAGGGNAVFVSPGLAWAMAGATEIHVGAALRDVSSRPTVGQLLTMVAFSRDHAFPMVHVLMEQRTTEAYVAVLNYVKTVLPDLRPQTLVTDYEPSLQRAVQQCFPAAQVHGCWYSFADAVCSKCRSLGLRSAFQELRKGRQAVQMCLALAFLPPRAIHEGYQAIVDWGREQDVSEPLRPILEYFRETWLEGVGPRKLSMHGMPSRAHADKMAHHQKLLEHVTEFSVWTLIDDLMNIDSKKTSDLAKLEAFNAVLRPTYVLGEKKLDIAINLFNNGKSTVREFLETTCCYTDVVYYQNVELLPGCEDGLAGGSVETLCSPAPMEGGASRGSQSGDLRRREGSARAASDDAPDVNMSAILLTESQMEQSNQILTELLGLEGLPESGGFENIQHEPEDEGLDSDPCGQDQTDGNLATTQPVAVLKSCGQRKNSRVYHYDGYSYHVNRGTATHVYLKCALHRCSARGSMKRHGDDTIRPSRPHNHARDRLAEERHRLKCAVMERCATETTALRRIFEEEVLKYPKEVSSAFSFDSLRLALYRARKQHKFRLPADLTELDDRLVNDSRYHRRHRLVGAGGPFYRGLAGDGGGVEGRNAVFVSPGLAGGLASSSELHMDGMFPGVSTRPAVGRLFTISASTYEQVFPIVHVLMGKRTTEAYVAVLNYVKTLLPDMQPQTIVAGYELSLELAIQKCFPASRVHGCWYSFADAVCRECRSLGLKSTLQELPEGKQVVKMCLALAILPPDAISEGYRAIEEWTEERNLSEPLRPFLGYFEETWLDRVGPRRLSVHGMLSRMHHETLFDSTRAFTILELIDSLMTTDKKKTSALAKLQAANPLLRPAVVLGDARIETEINSYDDGRRTARRFLLTVADYMSTVYHQNMELPSDCEDEGLGYNSVATPVPPAPISGELGPTTETVDVIPDLPGTPRAAPGRRGDGCTTPRGSAHHDGTNNEESTILLPEIQMELSDPIFPELLELEDCPEPSDSENIKQEPKDEGIDSDLLGQSQTAEPMATTLLGASRDDVYFQDVAGSTLELDVSMEIEEDSNDVPPVSTVGGIRENTKLYCFDGYSYHVNRSKNHIMYLKCSSHKCQARGCLKKNIDDKIRLTRQHNHEADPLLEERHKLKSAIIARCLSETTKPKDIFEEECFKFPLDVYRSITYDSMKSSMYRARKQQKLRLPANLSELGRQIDNRRRYRPVGAEVPFYRGLAGDGGGEEGRNAVFVSPGLASSTELHMDATFAALPSRPHVDRLFTIAASYRERLFPMVSVLMERSTTEAYVAVLNYVKTLLPDMRPVRIVADFDVSLQRAIQLCFPAAQVDGCWYSFADAVCGKWRSLGLKSTWQEYRNGRQAVQMCLALAFLPPHAVPEGHRAVVDWGRERNVSEPLRPFLEYFRETWLEEVGPRKLSVHGMASRAHADKMAHHQKLLDYGKEFSVWTLIDNLRSVIGKRSVDLAKLEASTAVVRPSTFLGDKRIDSTISMFNNGRSTAMEFLESVCNYMDPVYYYFMELLPNCADKISNGAVSLDKHSVAGTSASVSTPVLDSSGDHHGYLSHPAPESTPDMEVSAMVLQETKTEQIDQSFSEMPGFEYCQMPSVSENVKQEPENEELDSNFQGQGQMAGSVAVTQPDNVGVPMTQPVVPDQMFGTYINNMPTLAIVPTTTTYIGLNMAMPTFYLLP